MKKMIRLFNIIGLSLLVWSCNRFEMESPADEARNPSLMRFAASYPLAQTRADEAGFADGDKMGVFVTDYENGSPDVLKTDGNRADNVRFTFDESSMSWTGATDIYWKDDKTPVDIYGYYPFDADLSDVEDYRFSVSVRQDTAPTGSELGGYEASDLLWAKSENVHPTSEVVTLTYGHMMAGVKVILQMGEGFEEAEWASLDKTVLIMNTVTESSANLATRSVVPVEGGAKNIIVPYLYNDEYRAVVVPQIVEAGNELVSITVGGISYSFSRKDVMTYASGKMHNFTIIVKKSDSYSGYKFSLVEETISDWLNDDDFYDTAVKEYLCIHLSQPGKLERELREMNKDLDQIINLKITGKIDWSDLSYMAHNISNLSVLNLQSAIIDCDDDDCDDVFPSSYNGEYIFLEKHNLTKLELPSQLKRIESLAFYDTGLMGSLVLPEGLEEVGEWAFFSCKSLRGSLTLPTTLKKIGENAFAYCNFSGELILPEGILTIGSHAFVGNRFSGVLNLPESIRDVSTNAFNGNLFEGDIIIPKSLKKISGGVFAGNEFNGQLVLHENVEYIGQGAFSYNEILGEIWLPNSLKYVGNEAFANTRISHVYLPNSLGTMGKRAFADTPISGSVVIPEAIVSISEGLFENCTFLEEVILSKNVIAIHDRAFSQCSSLKRVVIFSDDPPVLAENAFEGVPRDNFTIEVPAGSVDKYKRAEGWREFKRIAEYSDFVCRPATSCALNSSRRQTLVLNADGPWTVCHLPEWCSVTPSNGNGKTEVILTINALAHGSAHRADSVVFTLTDGGHKTWCEVSQYDYEYDEDEVIALQKATKGNGIDVIFLGDGWDGEAVANGSYLSLVQEQMEHFFDVEPYTTYRDYFNVYAGISLSQETGANTLNTYRDTRFGTIYGGGGCNSVEPHMSVEKDQIFDYVTQHFPIQKSNLWKSLVILVPNSTYYGGCTQLYEDGSAISICCPSEQAYPNDTRGIIQHEAGGHGFGKLADEKIMKNLFVDKGTKNQIEDLHHRGWYQNVATSDKMSDVPWAHFIFDPEYSDYVDMFEGAMGFTRGVWRSEQNSCMNYGIPYYNAISRQEIMRRILDYSGEGFTMEKFYATDSKTWGSSSAQTKAMPDQAYVQNAWHTAPYVE